MSLRFLELGVDDRVVDDDLAHAVFLLLFRFFSPVVRHPHDTCADPSAGVPLPRLIY
jgi:hypothetical protein